MSYLKVMQVLHSMRMDYICSACEDRSEEECPSKNMCEEAYDALEKAIEACKLQVGLKPNVYKSYPDDIYTCPKCGSTYITRGKNEMDHCNNCGQCICWEDD